jgi:hypothetical protein
MESFNKTFPENFIKPEEKDTLLNNKNYIKNKILFYKIEENEIKNYCKANQILDDKNICQDCDKYCGTDDKCTNDTNCKIFCKKTCEEKNTDVYDSACGKPVKNKKNYLTTEDYNTPIDDEDITVIPNIQNAIKTAIKIFFIIIMCYIAYIFWQIYGETILTVFNLIIYYLYYLIILIGSYIYGFNVNSAMAQFKFSNIDSQYKKIDSKIAYYESLDNSKKVLSI